MQTNDYLRLLDEHGTSCLVLKGNDIIYKSQEDRLKPLLTLITSEDLKGITRGAILIDRVIGKSAYALAAYLGFEEVYTPLYSGMARQIETAGSPKVHFATEVDHIVNQAGDDWCPMESLVKDATTIDETVRLLFEKIGIKPV